MSFKNGTIQEFHTKDDAQKRIGLMKDLLSFAIVCCFVGSSIYLADILITYRSQF